MNQKIDFYAGCSQTSKLYADAGNLRAFKALIAAEYNNVDINVSEFDLANLPISFVEKSPHSSTLIFCLLDLFSPFPFSFFLSVGVREASLSHIAGFLNEFIVLKLAISNLISL